MNQPAATMPEAKFRSTKKQVLPAKSIRTSEFAHEVRVVAPKKEAVAVKANSKETGFSIVNLWPVAVGVFLAGFAPEWQNLAAQMGVWAMRLVFPLSLIATHREIGIDAQMAAMLPQWALYAQFPIDGLLLVMARARKTSLMSAMVQIALIHGLCAFVLWLVSMSVS